VNEVSAGATAPVAEWWGQIDYRAALDKMITAHAARVAGTGDDSFFYLEHPPVITYGRSTPATDLRNGVSPIPRLEVPRGGLATYHAPGQLVGYIILDLAQRSGGQRPDIHAYLRAIELGLICFLRAEFALNAGLREGFTGVWTVPDTANPAGRKLASIGVSARKWVTSHGFALNIHPDMSGFDAIVPCGITDAPMTSVKLELEREGKTFAVKTMERWAREAHEHIMRALQVEGWLRT